MPRNRKPSVIAGYRDHLRVHINPVLGSIAVTALTPEDCERFAHIVSQKPLKPVTQQKILITLSAMLTFAAKKKRLRTDNPAWGLAQELRDPDAPMHKVLESSQYFTADEAAHLLAVTREKFPAWYPFVLTGLWTGLRLGELLGLRWKDINWRRSFIHVTNAWVKGDWTSPKNRKPRDVTMARDLRAVLYLRWRRHRTSQLVFPSSVGTPFRHENVRRVWDRILTAAELNHRNVHAMRHTHTSLLLQQGKSPAWVAQQAGRSLQETLRTYAHFVPGSEREAVDSLAPLLGVGKDTRVSGAVTSDSQRQRRATNLRVVSR
jgi:integrase